MAKANDLTGKRYGRLTVLSLNPVPYRSPGGKSVRRWDCVCDCGKRITVLNNSLTSGTTQSCGCLQREKAEQQAQDLAGKRFGRLTVIKKVPLEKKRPNGTKNGWLCKCDCGNECVVLAKELLSGRQSCGCLRTEIAEHHVEKDNTLGRFDGTMTSKIKPGMKPTKASTTGVRGVYWSNKEKLYKVQITLRKKTIYIGRFHKLDDAIKARRAAEEKYFQPIIDDFNSGEK